MKTKTTLAALLLAAVMVPASTQAAIRSDLIQSLIRRSKDPALRLGSEEQQKQPKIPLKKLLKQDPLYWYTKFRKKRTLPENEVDRLLLEAMGKVSPKGALQKLGPADELLESMLKAKVPQQDAEKRLVKLYGKDWKTPKEKAPAE